MLTQQEIARALGGEVHGNEVLVPGPRSIREIGDVNIARIKSLLDDGLSVRDIADETGISKSTVGRLKKQIEAEAVAKEPLNAAA